MAPVAEDAPQDEEGMQTLRNLARNMIWMMRCFAVGKEQGVPYPETEKKGIDQLRAALEETA